MAKDKFKAKKKPEPPPDTSDPEDSASNWPHIPTLQDVFDAIKERKEEEND